MLKHLTLVVTSQCNSSCSYCQQIKSPDNLSLETANKAVEYLLSQNSENIQINFFGGEPLLNFHLIQKVIRLLKDNQNFDKNVIFALTTNGLLLNNTVLRFFSNYKVKISLSCDGLCESHEKCRNVPFDVIWKAYKNAKNAIGVEPMLQCTICRDNVAFLSENYKFFLKNEIPRVSFAFDKDQVWNNDDLNVLKEQMLNTFKIVCDYYKNKKRIPYNLFTITPTRSATIYCRPGLDRVAITPDGDVYGCSKLMPNNKAAEKNGLLQRFKNLCYGNINKDSIKKLEENRNNINDSYQSCADKYFSSYSKCKECSYFNHCFICPAIPMAHSENELQIPDHVCKLHRILLDFEELTFKTLFKKNRRVAWKFLK